MAEKYKRKIRHEEKKIKNLVIQACDFDYVDNCIAESMYYNRKDILLLKITRNCHHNYEKFFPRFAGKND